MADKVFTVSRVGYPIIGEVFYEIHGPREGTLFLEESYTGKSGRKVCGKYLSELICDDLNAAYAAGLDSMREQVVNTITAKHAWWATTEGGK